uniref:Palmitoyltransferase n=1 Tax=Sinocyclocheilus anshuiensis TaxID=1608454 RepID=A0A671M5S3_9TELE
MGLSRALRCCQRVFSWIPVIIISSVVLWSYYAYVFELCFVTLSNHLERVVYLLMFHVCFIMFCWTYWKAIFTPPSTPSKKFHLSYSDKERYEMEERPDVQKQILAEIAKKLPIFTRAQSGAIRFCDRCQVIKPDRCHHCSVCETCILKMDHHLFQYFLKFWVGDLPNGPAKFHVLFLLFVALMFFVSLMFLFGYHSFLLMLDLFQNGPDRNGFNVGLSRNLRQVFGEDKKLWFIPVFTSQGDGHYFPLRTLRESENPLLANEGKWMEDGGSDEESAGEAASKLKFVFKCSS